MRKKLSTVVPSVEEYKQAFLAIEASLPKAHREMLVANYHAPSRTITTTELAKIVGYKTYSAAVLQYGKLGHRLCKLLRFQPTMMVSNGDLVWTSVLADAPPNRSTDEWEWTLRPEVAQALEELGWVEAASSPTSKVVVSLLSDPQVHADEVQLAALEGRHYIAEAAFRRRNQALINAEKKQSDGKCTVCGFDFKAAYKVLDRNFLVGHHVKPIGKRKKATKTTLADIDILCPNCHAAVHSHDPPLSADDLRGMLVS